MDKTASDRTRNWALHSGHSRRTTTASVAAAALILVANTAAAAQPLNPAEGTATGAASALGISYKDAVTLETQWKALDSPTRQRIRCAGTRGRCRDVVESLRVYNTIPEVFRRRGPDSVAGYLSNKDWSHIVPQSRGGDDTAANSRWEVRKFNRARGARPMTPREVRAAERVARSASFRQHVTTLARRAAGGAAIGGVTASAVTVTQHAIDFHNDRITGEEFLVRLANAENQALQRWWSRPW